MKNTFRETVQSIKVAASQTLVTRVVKSQKHYTRTVKHKATKFSNEDGRFFNVLYSSLMNF